MKVLVVLGTRPEVIKLAPVISALKLRAEVRVCASGQHREMLQQALDAFDLQPHIMLDTMSPGRSLNILAARLLEALDAVLEREGPDWVLVQGDTTTAFCAGLAAFQRGIRVGHVEAGLRTGDLASPFPEEANRSLLSRVSTLHFAPTQMAAAAICAEGIAESAIRITGNTVVDAILQAKATWPGGMPAILPAAIEQRLTTGPTVLVTCHRRENFGSVMESFCHMLARLCRKNKDTQWIFPVHLNPSVREPVLRLLGQEANLLLTDPVDYHTSLYLISRARLVLSDSGGIQEEAPSFGTPVVVMRKHTERMEGVKAGFATLAGQDPVAIEAAVDGWLSDPARCETLRARQNPYGDGHASERIVSALFGEPCEAFHG
ncbi:non-hydrolyzing UDP-N-acetylglucosamine 2-epimerase [Uliginosibacterium sp. 31-12]|uniref:non-hydrolyzing UDP-N-acetylglucosamine 2-epimerase n=1 Tax=Uliginosibacterium sp. 31-12 TaxID=3062781 RepID=UPI0026E2AF92|nr:UDP-N-acetylglucosamine 2-epimerase (non-hydrolyzing) [Uliginosibacterium sp. 31-12]MDO6388176.1 UDP-N-acetylglucosamine 2-epimerase (non-hydrolyzing) [Uliginosibacterium sp. 31-12]